MELSARSDLYLAGPGVEVSLTMELPKSGTKVKQEQTVSDREATTGSASLFVRLWAYSGPGKQLSGLDLKSDTELAVLLSELIRDGNGEIVEDQPHGLVAQFDRALQALVAAKTLQQRLLMLHRQTSPQQVVAAILISARSCRTEKDLFKSTETILEPARSAQILVEEGIRELADNEPGFQFSAKPVLEASGGASEAIYELLWTDESTYGHLRDTGSSTGIRTAGRYQIQSELGRGNMGVVYKAYDQLIGRTVALKTISIHKDAPNRRELIERLKLEAKAAGSLDHPNIITIFDVGQEDDRVYLSMQFLEGKTLQALLDEGGLPPLAALVSYAEQICSAVDYAHGRGVIHRDLKPTNLMLTSNDLIKVLDFGIAKLGDATLTQAGMVVGTPTHMAPEQVAGKKLDHRTDIFALGSVLYELFTREKPFRGDITTIFYKIMHEDPLPPSIINPALPGGIDAIIRKALAKDPDDRYQSCAEMVLAFREQAALLKTAALRDVADAGPATPPAARAGAPSAAYPLQMSTRGNRRVWPSLVAGVLLATMATAGWAYYVKIRTGFFPSRLRKVVAMIRRGAERPGTNPSGNKGQVSSHPQRVENTQNAPDGEPANQKPIDPNVSTSPAGGTGESVSAAPQQSAAVPGLLATSSTTQSQPPGTAQDAAHGSSEISAGVTPGKMLSEKTANAGESASSQGVTQPSPVSMPNEKGQPATENSGAAGSSVSASNAAKPASAGDQTPAASQPKAGVPTTKPAARETTLRVDGFSRRDVPELLRQADAAAARGDYGQARYAYTLILKLDHNNAAARAGFRRAQAAEQFRSQH